MCKVLIATGGTGGHVYPAIALGNFLSKKGLDVIFTGRKDSFEDKTVKNYNFKLLYVKSRRFKGEKLFNKVFSLFTLLINIISALKVISNEKPDYIIGTGGYVAAPVVFAGILKRVRTSICEQNALMGFGNRVLSHFVDSVFTNFTKTKYSPRGDKRFVTGNFIRDGFSNQSKRGILVFGGSQGAEKINNIFPTIVEELSQYQDLKIYHITGEKSYHSVKQYYESIDRKPECEIYPYYEKMNELFEKVDLVISRSGATSISEIYYTDKRAILVPYPYAADNHQWYNALQFCKTGRGVILKDNFLTSENLLKWIKFFIDNRVRFDSDFKAMGNFREGMEYIYKSIKGCCNV